MHMFGDYGMGFGGGGMIMMILFWAIIVSGAIYLVKLFVSKEQNGNQKESAMDILKIRYAKGEISFDEYEKIRKDLES